MYCPPEEINGLIDLDDETRAWLENNALDILVVSDVTREKNKKQVDLFWKKMTSKAEYIYVGEPALPRRRNAPMRF